MGQQKIWFWLELFDQFSFLPDWWISFFPKETRAGSTECLKSFNHIKKAKIDKKIASDEAEFCYWYHDAAVLVQMALLKKLPYPKSKILGMCRYLAIVSQELIIGSDYFIEKF